MKKKAKIYFQQSYGLSDVMLCKDGTLRVEHRGNMGDTKAFVAKDVFSVTGIKLSNLELIEEIGSPDYLYHAIYKIG